MDKDATYICTFLSAFKISLSTFLDKVPDMTPQSSTHFLTPTGLVKISKTDFVVEIRCTQSMGAAVERAGRLTK